MHTEELCGDVHEPGSLDGRGESRQRHICRAQEHEKEPALFGFAAEPPGQHILRQCDQNAEMGSAYGKKMIDPRPSEPELCRVGQPASIAEKHRCRQSAIPDMGRKMGGEGGVPLLEQKHRRIRHPIRHTVRAFAGKHRTVCAVIPFRVKGIVRTPILHRDAAAEPLSTGIALRGCGGEDDGIRQLPRVVMEPDQIGAAIHLHTAYLRDHAISGTRFADHFPIGRAVQIMVHKGKYAGCHARGTDQKRNEPLTSPFPAAAAPQQKTPDPADGNKQPDDPMRTAETGKDAHTDVEREKEYRRRVFSPGIPHRAKECPQLSHG